MSFFQGVAIFLLSAWMAVFSLANPSVQGSSRDGFGAGGRAWTERYHEFSAMGELPLAISFERTGGAGENTHVYRGFTQQDILINVMTRPYEETIRYVQVSLKVPEEAPEAAAEAIQMICAVMDPCMRASAPSISAEEVASFQRRALRAFEQNEAAVLEAHGLQFIAQAARYHPGDLPTAYTLLITPAPDWGIAGGQPAFSGWQTKLWTMLNSRGTGTFHWNEVPVTSHSSGGEYRELFSVLMTGYTRDSGRTHSSIAVYTDAKEPYYVKRTQVDWSATGEWAQVEMELDDYLALCRDMALLADASLTDELIHSLFASARKAFNALKEGAVPEEEVRTDLALPDRDVRFYFQSAVKCEGDTISLKCSMRTEYGK